MGISAPLHVYGKGVCTGTIDPPPLPSIPICPLVPFNVILEQMPFYALQPL